MAVLTRQDVAVARANTTGSAGIRMRSSFASSMPPMPGITTSEKTALKPAPSAPRRSSASSALTTHSGA